MKKRNAIILFLIILMGVAFYYSYHTIAFKRPQSIHKWRQSDCASIALNYYEGGMNFFIPETHNLTSDGGTSGKSCTSEIPVLYYMVAIFYKIFGYNECIYRIFNTLIFFLGLFYLFRLLYYLLKDTFWAITLTLLFFTAPVLVYYGNNFLSNSSALAFSFIGWYYFIRFVNELKYKYFLISMLVFLGAGAFKVTAFFSLFAITGVIILELLGITKFRGDKKLFIRPVRFLTVIFSVFLVVGSWIVYAHFFNLKHDCTYFSTTLFPIWSLDKTGIDSVLKNIREIWLNQYFHQSALIFLTVCFLFVLGSFRKGNKILNFSILFIFIEVITYVVLQFWTFSNHDYYVIDIYILPVLVVVSAFYSLSKNHPSLFNSATVKIIFSLFLIFNIYYAHQQIKVRYNGWMNNITNNNDISTITPYLRQIGIAPNDTVISIPDDSHVSLYLMNQKGWTEYTDARFNRGKKTRYNQDSLGIQYSIDKGAQYLIINGIQQLYFKPYLQSFCTNLSGHYNNTLIFNLKEKNKNFNLSERTIVNILSCDAESLSNNNLQFINRNDSICFQNGNTRSSEFAHSGNYSSKIETQSPYGMTIKLSDLTNGESFAISVWRKSPGNSTGSLVVSSNSPNEYYNNKYSIVETTHNGWEKLLIEFFITSELSNQELGVYLFNPNTEPAYFDDLEIKRYESVFNESTEN